MRFDPPRLTTRRPKNDDERILPLVNVVFLLLIFFMIAGRLAASDPFATTPPRSASAGAPEPGALVVLVGADGRLALDGTVMEAAALEAAVAARLAAEAGVRVQLKADGGAEATAVVAVMERLRTAGVERLSLLTVPEDG